MGLTGSHDRLTTAIMPLSRGPPLRLLCWFTVSIKNPMCWSTRKDTTYIALFACTTVSPVGLQGKAEKDYSCSLHAACKMHILQDVNVRSAIPTWENAARTRETEAWKKSAQAKQRALQIHAPVDTSRAPQGMGWAATTQTEYCATSAAERHTRRHGKMEWHLDLYKSIAR